MKGSGLMEVVLPLSRLGEMTAYMDERVSRHLHEGQSEAFEGFEEFDLIAFDWYDVHSDWTEDSRFLLYLDREHLLCFCEEERGLRRAREIFSGLEEEQNLSHPQRLYRFFARLLNGDMDHLDQLEGEMREKHIRRLSKGKCDPESGVIFLDIISNLERISDHAVNVADYVKAEAAAGIPAIRI